MTADESNTVSSAPSEGRDPSTRRPTGYARVARKIGRRTTDLLAIAIIAVGGLAVGGRLSQWWSTEPEEVTSSSRTAGAVSGSPSPWGRSALPVFLEFGDRSCTLRKQSVAGDRGQASKALLGICREVVAAVSVPSDPRDLPRPGDLVPDNERRLLAEMQKRDPVEEQTGSWRIYADDETLPLVLATRRVPSGSEPSGRDSSAADGWRVVCWGMAFPDGEARWTLFAFQTPGRADSPPSDEIELPPGSRRIMSLRAETGEALIGFEGAGPAEEWVRFFDGWFRENGWRLSGRWTSSAKAWTARYIPRESKRTSRVDVHFARTAGSTWNGLLDVVPIPEGTPSRETNSGVGEDE